MNEIGAIVLALFIIGVIGWAIYIAIEIKNAPRM